MSELTRRCNYCTLQAIKKDNPGKEVIVKRTDPREATICDLQVYVDGKGIDVWFWELSDHCVC